jgi:hypothetical protein
MAYSLGMEPSDVGSEQVGGGGCRLVSSFFPIVDAIMLSNPQWNLQREKTGH